MIDAQRANQRWLFGLLVVITGIYLALTFSWLVKNQQQQDKLQDILKVMPLLLPVQQLTQQLQTERAISAGFVTQQLPARPPIELQQLLTDASWRDLNLVIADNPIIAQTTMDYVSTLPNQQLLTLLRQNILEQQLNSSDVKRTYTSLLRPFLDLAKHLQQKNRLASLAKPLSAIVALNEAVERAGQEQTTLHVAFAEQQMSPSRYQSFVILINEQIEYLHQFALLTTPQIQQQWLTVQSQFENGSFIELREQALAQQFDGDVTLWFELATSRMDKIYQLRFVLCQELLQQAQTMNQHQQQTLQQLQGQLQWLLLIFMLLLWRLYRLYHRPSSGQSMARHSHQF